MNDDENIEKTEVHGEDEITEEASNEAFSSAVSETVTEGIKESVEVVLDEEGIEHTPELIDEGHRMLAEDVQSKDEETNDSQNNHEKEKHGSENKSSHIAQDKSTLSREENIPENWLKKEPSKREKLTALKEGLEEFVSNEYARLEKRNLRDDIHQEFLEKGRILRKISAAEEKIAELNKTISSEPPDEAIDWDEVPDWKADFVAHENRSRRAKLSTIKSIAAEGIEMNGKWGMEALGELSNDYDSLITQARIAAELASGERSSSSSIDDISDSDYDDEPTLQDEDDKYEDGIEIRPYG